jgi:hypothetical protein
VPLALGVLQLTHPTWTEGSVSQGVAAARGWWIPLHVLLLVGYVALAATLWPEGPYAAVSRALLVAFVVCNTAFLAIDGLVVGSLAASQPSTADSVWNSPLTVGVADLTGALWCAALLAIGATRVSGSPSTSTPSPSTASATASAATASTSRAPISTGKPPRSLVILAVLIWGGFVASLVTPAAIVVGSLGLVFAVYRTYARRGARAGVTFGLLALAALARQHVGIEAALGMAWIALAALGDALRGRPYPERVAATGRSDPAASCPRGSD